MKSDVDEINESDEDNSSITSINSSFQKNSNKIKIFNFNNEDVIKTSEDQESPLIAQDKNPIATITDQATVVEKNNMADGIIDKAFEPEITINQI